MSLSKPTNDFRDAGIVQFGTGRFLLAHVDTLVSESLANGDSDERILVVQSSTREEGKRKARLLAERRRYPVRIRGRRDGEAIDREQTVDSVAGCLIAAEQWDALERHVIEHARIIVSNTADNGYEVGDDSSLATVPASFPGKLTHLLRARFEAGNDGLTILPCELIEHNASRLQSLVTAMARRDGVGTHDSEAFLEWLDNRCVWADTLVDRIVSEPLEPLGAIAEPYALWAIARQPGMAIPCTHSDVEIVDDLGPQAMCKLHILNLAHTYLVDRWQREGRPVEFVREAMEHSALVDPLHAVLEDEVLPTLATELPMARLQRYLAVTLERFANPFLDHRLADIAQNHAAKRQRRLQPVVDKARLQGRATPRLDDALSQ
ncbi:MAG: mannitol dehydrogenase [Salinicola sp.]|uniref:mannitol dehydrogenase family protein n=1 Tax=Salinicola sp. TaxID=1978524 RepID=UPI001DCED3FA|nr:mannitol dehydrogenase [Salinicola sp.]NRB57701.1 mannitol dehydrogenase [Salinicola sp.]